MAERMYCREYKNNRRPGAMAVVFVHFGGAVGELPPESETPNPHFLQAQFRFCLRPTSFLKPESRLPQLLLSRTDRGAIPHPSRIL
jgi:hypothetical protein